MADLPTIYHTDNIHAETRVVTPHDERYLRGLEDAAKVCEEQSAADEWAIPTLEKMKENTSFAKGRVQAGLDMAKSIRALADK